MKKFTIWQNYDFDMKDWADFLEEEYPDVTNEYEQYQLVSDMNNEYLDDEKMNLNIQLNNDILIIADIGLWNGRRCGYRDNIGTNLNDCLQFKRDCDYAEWYIDELGDLRSRQSHHDGTHYLMYRVWKDGVSETQRDNLLDKLYTGNVTRRDITRYTERLGDYVAAVYGWKIPRAKKVNI